MSKSKPSKMGICTYCGFRKPVTADHVPPKNLFDQPYPRNMFTVPACADCNGGFKKDDDYFRIALTISDKAKGQRARDAVLPTVMRGINRPRADRFRATLLSNSQILPRYSSGGIFLGNQQAMQFEGARLERIARRIVQGMFFRVKHQRLPGDHAINVVPVGRFRELASLHPEGELALREFVATVEATPLTTRGDVFGFRWLQSPNGSFNTMWLLYFYERLEFFCTTFQPADLEGLTVEMEIKHIQRLARKG